MYYSQLNYLYIHVPVFTPFCSICSCVSLIFGTAISVGKRNSQTTRKDGSTNNVHVAQTRYIIIEKKVSL